MISKFHSNNFIRINFISKSRGILKSTETENSS